MVDYLKNKTWGGHQRGLFITMISLVLLIAVFYIYCISAMVMGTVARSQNLQNLQIIKREYQELEKNYLSLLSKFNLDYAYSLGFIGANSLSYVARQIPVAQNTGYEKTLR